MCSVHIQYQPHGILLTASTSLYTPSNSRSPSLCTLVTCHLVYQPRKACGSIILGIRGLLNCSIKGNARVIKCIWE